MNKDRRKLLKDERIQIYEKYNGHCAYCGCEINFKGYQADHIIPLHLGGKDEVSNMTPACRSCNHYKHTLTVEKFREYIEKIPDRLRRDNVAYQVGERFGIVSSSKESVKFYFEIWEGGE